MTQCIIYHYLSLFIMIIMAKNQYIFIGNICHNIDNQRIILRFIPSKKLDPL